VPYSSTEQISEVVIQSTMFDINSENCTLPSNWFCDITRNIESVVDKTYFTLSPLNLYNKRIVEKQFLKIEGF